MNHRMLIATFAVMLAGTTPLPAKDASYVGSVETISGSSDGVTRGTVFLDANRNSRLDEGEAGIQGVMVSNGREVVLTAGDGSYELPAYDDMNLFITKPSGHLPPVDAQMVPQFNYIHKVAGSPDLRFGGIAPTGPLPAEINFPLIADNVGDEFECLIFGDVQAYTNREVGYVRETLGKMLANRDNTKTECLIFEGDIAGDDLALYPRIKSIGALGSVPQYWVGGNHDIDFDATSDADSFDTFRAEWGPEYYSFDIGNVHFVTLDNVRYPCNGIDPHPFCSPDRKATYNGVISDRQLAWLENDLAQVPKDKLIILNAHIPFQSFTDAQDAKSQTDNFDKLAALVEGRTVLGLSGHTHTTENILPGESYEGWHKHTHVHAAPFHQIVTGAVSGSWWAGDLNDEGVPRGNQRLGAPRGFYKLSFDGSDYTDTYVRFGGTEDEQLHVSFSTPRFRQWARELIAYTQLYGAPSDVLPPVTVNDLFDPNMVTRADLQRGTWVAVNVWNGSRDSQVSITINGGEPMIATRTQEGEGEAKKSGSDYADPLTLAKQSTNGRMAFKSARNKEATDGFSIWRGDKWQGIPGPFRTWMLSVNSQHLWRVDLPADLPAGVHRLTAQTTDRYGRTFDHTIAFEVVETAPPMAWQNELWEQ